ncbi:DUF1272 domain-containing protein [Ekhidna sp.]
MLEIRPTCENCNKSLPANSTEAMICTFECTFCKSCVDLFQNVCPNCSGGFVPRPVRPADLLKKYPLTDKIVYKPVDMDKQKELIEKFAEVDPKDR